jgi:hypothetical protein
MDIYDVNGYTDEQIYDVLDMNNPSDNELEAKILQMLNKYDGFVSDTEIKLYNFFDRIYKRFFKTDDDDDDIEGFIDEEKNNTENNESEKNESEKISSVQQLDYSKDSLQLNPLLRQTIKRVISIDSQYRNIGTYPNSSSFSFDLSEPLRDVVSLKLYSIQIPYTWYTVPKSYGSNFFYINGKSPGIENIQYKIEIEPGNYDQTTIIEALNNSFNDISNGSASDINFNGKQLLYYSPITSKTTISLDIQNVFNEGYYSLSFPYFTYPIDISNNTSSTKSISGFLGFNQKTYSISALTSKPDFLTTSIINSQINQDYILDNSNNYFEIIQYTGNTPSNSYDENSTKLNTLRITLNRNGLPYIGNATRQNIIDSTNEAITKSGYFDISSKIERVDISNVRHTNNNYSYFKLNLILNRNRIKYVPNSKIVVAFPIESPRINQYLLETFTIWGYKPNVNYSCFYFDDYSFLYSELLSETPVIQSTISIGDNTFIFMKCTTNGFTKDGINDISMNIPTGSYTINAFLNAINDSFSRKNINNILFNTTNTNAVIDLNNYFRLNIDLTKSFVNKDYKVDINESSFLKYGIGGDTTNRIIYSIVDTSNVEISGNELSGNYSINLNKLSYIKLRIPKKFGGYTLSGETLFIIEPDTDISGGGGNKDISNIDVNILNNTPTTYQSLLSYIINSFTRTTITTTQNIQRPLVQSIVTYNDTNIEYTDMSINIIYKYYLEESDYDIFFEDVSSSLSKIWNDLNIDNSYNLITNEETGIATIRGNEPVNRNLLSSITVYDNCNNTITLNTTNTNAPLDNIKITIASGTYTTGPLITAINNQLTKNPKTYGSYIELVTIDNEVHTRLWLNINKIYTTEDYIITFYDPVDFVSCFTGSTSVRSTTWDSTIGWILGFRDFTQYILISENQTTTTDNNGIKRFYRSSREGKFIIEYNKNIQSELLTNVYVSLTGDTSLSTNLFNYLLISLDDFNQNHLNDGLVTITRNQTSIEEADSKYASIQTCDPATNEIVITPTPQENSNNITNAQLYSLNQSSVSQQNPNKEYSPGPFIKDLFGIIPIKPPSNTGDYYTEFGGSLQNQDRLYFGPVNIRKMAIQLLTDKGTIIDLNNSNWTFSFICEQLYRSTSA